MKRAPKRPLFKDMPKDYAGLTAMFAPRLIHTDKEFNQAFHYVEQLAVQDKLSRDQSDYLDLLTILVDRYSFECMKESPWTSALERLRSLASSTRMKPSQLGSLLGKPALGAQLLAGKAKLTKSQVSTLAAHLKLSKDYFI